MTIRSEAEILEQLEALDARIELLEAEDKRVGQSLWDNGKIPGNQPVQRALEGKLAELEEELQKLSHLRRDLQRLLEAVRKRPPHT